MTAPAKNPNPCKQCRSQPRVSGRGQHFCADCKKNRRCPKCASPLKQRADGNLTCGVCNVAQKMRKYHEDPDAYNTARCLKRYGITQSQYDDLVLSAQGRCTICREKPSGERHEGRLHIDHDHVTGNVRGLLCGRCNKALGLVRDNVDVLQNMIKYLYKTL